MGNRQYNIDKITGGDASRYFFASGESVDPSSLMYYIDTENVCITKGLPDKETLTNFIKSITYQGGFRQYYEETTVVIWKEKGEILFQIERAAIARSGWSFKEDISYYTQPDIAAELILLFFENTKKFQTRALELGNSVRMHGSCMYNNTNEKESLNTKTERWRNKNTLTDETFWHISKK